MQTLLKNQIDMMKQDIVLLKNWHTFLSQWHKGILHILLIINPFIWKI